MLSSKNNCNRDAPDTLSSPRQRRKETFVFGLLTGLSALPFQALAYSEQGILGDAASWRSEEFKRNWGLGAIGADYAYARGLSGAGIGVGVYDSGTELRQDEFAGKPHKGVPLADPGCVSESVLAGGCFFTAGDRSAMDVLDSLPPDALAGLEDLVTDGGLAREALDDYLDNVGAYYDVHGTLVAGIAQYDRRKFTLWNVAGAVGWAASVVLLGTWLGHYEIVSKNIDVIAVALVLVSVLPGVISFLLKRRAAASGTLPSAPEGESAGDNNEHAHP